MLICYSTGFNLYIARDVRSLEVLVWHDRVQRVWLGGRAQLLHRPADLLGLDVGVRLDLRADVSRPMGFSRDGGDWEPWPPVSVLVHGLWQVQRRIERGGGDKREANREAKLVEILQMLREAILKV